jgi:hypothetical protein
MDNVNSQRRKVGKAVSFSTLAANASLEEWRLDADIDETCIRPIAEAFDANPSIPLTIIKDVREQDMELAENLFKMSEFNPGAKAGLSNTSQHRNSSILKLNVVTTSQA